MEIETLSNHSERNSKKSLSDGYDRKNELLFEDFKNDNKKWSLSSNISSKLHSIPDVYIQTYNDDKNSNLYFYRAIRGVMIIIQSIGLLPITDVRKNSSKDMIFKKFSFRSIYASLMSLIMCFVTLKSLIEAYYELNDVRSATSIHILLNRLSGAISTTVYFGCNFFSYLLFFKNCKGWIIIQQSWTAVEDKLDNFNCDKPKLRRKFKIITLIILIMALMDDGFYLYNDIFYGSIYEKEFNVNITIKEIFSNLIYWFDDHTRRTFFFDLTEKNFLNYFYASLLFIHSRISSITYYFTDLFIILIAIGITDEYKRLNKRMLEVTLPELAYLDWQEARICYAALSDLVKKIDDKFSGIILLSYFGNIYFIYLHLLNAAVVSANKNYLISIITYFGELIFLIIRAIFVTISIARIYDQGKAIIPVLYNCPSENYTMETMRLQHQIGTDKVVLTGNGFFPIHRNFLLAVVGAFFTYQAIVFKNELN